VKDVEKAVLRILEDSELELTPANIAKNAGYSRGYIRQECTRMESLGLLKKNDTGSHPFYSISDKGRAYLAGELEEEELNVDSSN
jgi:DNA-binding transcriptional regulator PaaX